MFFMSLLLTMNCYLATRNPAGIYLFQVNNGDTRICEICSKLAMKTSERRHLHSFGVLIVNFEQNSHIVLLFLLLTLNKLIPAGKGTARTSLKLISYLSC